MTGRRVNAAGPRNARVMIVGEAPGADEERQGQPFVGPSGQQLDSMLAEADIDRADCYVTNVCKYRPPGNEIEAFFLDKKLTIPGRELSEGISELHADLQEVNPNVVIAFGNTPLWALTGQRGITSWRGSQLQTSQIAGRRWKLVPTYHPAAVLRMWHGRAIAVHDLRRAKREAGDAEFRLPPWKFDVRPTLDRVLGALWSLQQRPGPVPLAVDLETRAGHTACIGLAWSSFDAICIPLMDAKRPDFSYWSLSEEQQIVAAIRTLLLSPHIRVVGQNFLYDLQYLIRFWGCNPHVDFDTMLAQHVAFPGTPKGLDYLSSMYCDFHQYWKDEGKDFDPFKHDEERLWTYNCRDAVATFECAEVLRSVLTQLQRIDQFNFQMHDLYPAVLGMMLRGVPIDTSLRGALATEILGEQSQREAMVNYFAGRPVNPRSPKQLQELFYQEFAQKPVINRKTGSPTTDEDALNLIAKREPLLRRLCGAINETRALGSAMNVLRAPLDLDARMRCSYNIAGAETFRFSSSENAFGVGTNLQNITSGRVSEYTGLQLPNMRRLMVPPHGHCIAEGDLDRADLQVVVWEANDQELKIALRDGIDIHLLNAGAIFGIREITLDRLRDPAFVKYAAEKYHIQRQVAKIFCHASNYGGRSRTVAAHCGLTVYETDVMQARWFNSHPGIKAWHRRTDLALQTTRSVRNAFGYVRFYFDRIEECLPEALAWVPQSTVALVINKILVNFNRDYRDRVTLLLQVHDSLVFQFRRSQWPATYDSTAKQWTCPGLSELLPATRVVVPYPDPLIIPVSFKMSDKSWGDCKPLDKKLLIPAIHAAA